MTPSVPERVGSIIASSVMYTNDHLLITRWASWCRSLDDVDGILVVLSSLLSRVRTHHSLLILHGRRHSGAIPSG